MFKNDTKISSQASAEWRRRRRRFFKNALKENLAKLIQLMEKLQMFFIGNGIKLSILLPHAISTRRRRRATNPGRFARYVARKMSENVFFSLFYRHILQRIDWGVGDGGGARGCCMAPDSRATFFRQAHNTLHWMLRNSRMFFCRWMFERKCFSRVDFWFSDNESQLVLSITIRYWLEMIRSLIWYEIVIKIQWVQ